MSNRFQKPAEILFYCTRRGFFLDNGVRAALDNKTYSEPVNVFEEDPELAERLYNVVREFKRPTLGRRKEMK